MLRTTAEGEGRAGSHPGEHDADNHGSGAGESVCTGNFAEGLFHRSGALILPADGHYGVETLIVLVTGAAVWKARRRRGYSSVVSPLSRTVDPPVAPRRTPCFCYSFLPL